MPCFPAATLVAIIDDEERILLLSTPGQNGWQVVAGAIEHGETVLEAALRETREEVGADLRVRPLGTAHTSSFWFDQTVGYLVSILYVMAYEGGDVSPGSDMAGSAWRWETIANIQSGRIVVNVPHQVWTLERAVQLSTLWRNDPAPPLESWPRE